MREFSNFAAVDCGERARADENRCGGFVTPCGFLRQKQERGAKKQRQISGKLRKDHAKG